MDKKQIIIGVVLLFVAFALYDKLSPFSIIDDPLYSYSSASTLSGFNILSKSNQPSGQASVLVSGGGSKTVKNNPVDFGLDFSIDFSGESSAGGIDGISYTTNLNFIPAQYQKLIIDFVRDGSLSGCTTQSLSYCSGPESSSSFLYLIKGDELTLLYTGQKVTPKGSADDSQYQSAHVILTNNGDGTFSLDVSGDKSTLYGLNGSYELLIKSDIVGIETTLQSVGTQKEKFTITNIEKITFPATTKQYFRFQNNTCIDMTILESERTPNDYDLLSQCNSKVVSPLTKTTYYRFQNSTCINKDLFPNETTSNDYLVLTQCLSLTSQNTTSTNSTNSTGIITQGKCYAFVAETCQEVSCASYTNTYSSLSLCQESNKGSVLPRVAGIGFVVIVGIALLLWFIYRRYK